jgi:crotonobetainyl-CoA:carnitine CoA-transferase CaiB-like acyl-CoA transferase
VNAKLAHREEEFAAALLPQAPPRPRHDDPFAAAAAAARAARSEKDRVDRLARALAAALGEATRGDLARGFHAAGLPVAKLDEHLERMLVAAVLFEPRPGRYKAF